MNIRVLLLMGVLLISMGAKTRPALPWSHEKHRQMAHDAQARQKGRSPYLYPIQDTAQIAKQFPDRKVPIFCYGSLLNERSARRTISEETYASYRPAVAFGVVKVFNRHVPEAAQWGVPGKLNDTAMLNLCLTGDRRDVTNGVLFYADEKNLKRLAKREVGYDLYPVSVILWEEAVDSDYQPNVIEAYTFIAPDEPREGKVYVRRSINPVLAYTYASMEGAAQYGEEFLRLWLETTLLADRKTPLAEWENDSEMDMRVYRP